MTEKKQVRLMIGEGENKFEIGIADLTTMPDGSTQVEITLTAEKYAQALGTGVKLTGVLPPRELEIDYGYNAIAFSDHMHKDFEDWQRNRRIDGRRGTSEHSSDSEER